MKAHNKALNVINSEDRAAYTVQVKPSEKGSRAVPLDDDQIIELARDILRERNARKGFDTFTAPAAVRTFLRDHYLGVEREEFAVLLLDSQHKLIHIETLFTGTINAAPVYPREVLKIVLKYNAAAIMLAHNHPSGSPEPSQADIRVTERLKNALNVIDVSLLDHFVVGDPEIVSLAERGLI